jgi:hypothetical protein
MTGVSIREADPVLEQKIHDIRTYNFCFEIILILGITCFLDVVYRPVLPEDGSRTQSPQISVLSNRQDG